MMGTGTHGYRAIAVAVGLAWLLHAEVGWVSTFAKVESKDAAVRLFCEAASGERSDPDDELRFVARYKQQMQPVIEDVHKRFRAAMREAEDKHEHVWPSIPMTDVLPRLDMHDDEAVVTAEKAPQRPRVLRFHVEQTPLGRVWLEIAVSALPPRDERRWLVDQLRQAAKNSQSLEL